MSIEVKNDTFVYLGADGKPHEAIGTFAGTLSGGVFTPATFLPPGRAAATASVPVVLSNEDKLALGDENSFRNITTATTTQVKTGAGVLHLVNIGVKGTVASTITIYDGLSAAGTKIGIIDSLNLSGAFMLDVVFSTGLCIVSTGTVAPDFTVSYR